MSKTETLSEIKRLRDLRTRAVSLATQALFSRDWDLAMRLVREAQEYDDRADALAARTLKSLGVACFVVAS